MSSKEEQEVLDDYSSSVNEENESAEENDETDNNNADERSEDPVQDPDDPELEAIKARVRDMEEEAEKLRQMQEEVDKQMNSGTAGSVPLSLEEKMEVDARSIYVGNVDYSATADDLERHFHGCGSVNRVTILVDKFSGHPKGFAYIEFADKDSVQTATALDESLFKGRQIKVTPKRTNRPGLSSTNRGRGRGRGRGMYGRGYGFRGPIRGRGRGRGWYSPY